MPDNDMLTTGQCAKLTGFSNQKINSWVDRGILRGFKIPGSRDGYRHRRVYRDDLIRFCKEHGIRILSTDDSNGDDSKST